MRRVIVCVVLVAAALGSAALPLPWPIGNPWDWGGDGVTTTTISNANWTVKTGATAADLGIDALGGSLTSLTGGAGNNDYLLREAWNGEVVFSASGDFTTTVAKCKMVGDATLGADLNTAGKAVHLRRRFSFEKRTATGHDDAVNGLRVFGDSGTGYPRVTATYGLNPSNATGHHLELDPAQMSGALLPHSPEWDTVHLMDLWIERNASTYSMVVLLDGVYMGHASGLSLLQVRQATVWNYWPGNKHWLNFHGGSYTTYASGGIAGNLGSPLEEVSDGGRYTLPDLDDESIMVLHGAAGQIAEGAEITLNSVTATGPEIYDTVWKIREGMDAVPTGIDKGQLSTSTFLPAYDAAIAAMPAYRIVGHSGMEILFYDDDDNPEWGFLIPDGTDATVTLQLRRWNGSAWASVDTGIEISRTDPVTVINFSLKSGQGIGVSASNCDILGEAAEHLQWYSDDGTVFTGMMAARGWARANFSDPAPRSFTMDSIEHTRPRPATGQVVRFVLGAFSATSMDFVMPMIGCQANLGIDSYVQGEVAPPDDSIATPASVTVAFQARRVASLRGRWAGQGVTPDSRAVGPFLVEGRGGADLRNFLDDTLGGDSAGYFRATSAIPRQLISVAVNHLDRPGGDVDPAANLADLKAVTLATVAAYRAAGIWFALPIMPMPEEGEGAPGSDWTADQRDAGREFNQWIRDQDAKGTWAGGYIADAVTVLGGEADATIAAGLNLNDVHPANDRVVMDAVVNGLRPAVSSGQRSRDRYSDTRGAMSRGAK